MYISRMIRSARVIPIPVVSVRLPTVIAVAIPQAIHKRHKLHPWNRGEIRKKSFVFSRPNARQEVGHHPRPAALPIAGLTGVSPVREQQGTPRARSLVRP